MTVEDIQRESFFRQLSKGQQSFVTKHCEGMDLKDAARASWNCKDDASATAMASRAMRNANVKWLIGQFFGKGTASRVPTHQELAEWNWNKAQTVSDPGLAIKFAQNVAQILGYNTRPADPLPKTTADDGDESFDL